MDYFVSIIDGFNDWKNYVSLQVVYFELICKVVEVGILNVICFSGNWCGMKDSKGLDNCVRGLELLVK